MKKAKERKTIIVDKKWVRTHRQIMHSAKKLFEVKGIARTTVEDIAIGAGIARSTFFTHYKSLDELYYELSDIETSELYELLERLHAESAEDKDILKELFSKLVDDTVKYPKAFVELMVKNTLRGSENVGYAKLEQMICKFIASALGVSDIYVEDEQDGEETSQNQENNNQYKAQKIKGQVLDMYGKLLGMYYVLTMHKIARDEDFASGQDIKNSLHREIDSLGEEE